MSQINTKLQHLIGEIKTCTVCKDFLPLEPNPVLEATSKSKILIIGQAPGTRVHNTGIPWNDPSGDRLRKWMDLDKATFYDTEKIAIIPMGFCYPGKGKSGDLPPRKECAPLWHQSLLDLMPEIELTLLIGRYAQQYYLGKNSKKTLLETVKSYEDFLPKFLPLVHPSPRNTYWLRKNPWFEEKVVPELQLKIQEMLA
ncbi:MAG: uracil-DNA glycosylase family protein [Flammeovirgaceae bacterium]|nr:uracil-DNA glycosylase family protein [Flammeovirgaceae bacterium]